MEKYSKQMTWVLLAVIALAVLPGLLRRLRIHRPTLARRLTNVLPGYYLVAAACRRVGYSQLGNSRYAKHVPPLGASFLIFAVCAATVVWCFSIKPYYRCTREWGSPPLAIRSGMMANAMIPFIFALGTKVNMITILTSLSHERLQIYHQWIARLCLFFSVVHTLPFIIQPLREGGSHNLYLYWYTSGGATYWNGTVALAILAWMVASSTRAFRNMSYEFFVVQHVSSILLFLGFYFYHTGNTLNSWIWLWATVGIWGLSTLVRWSRAAMASSYFVNMHANVEIQAGDLGEGQEDPLVRVSVSTPVRWSPAQHVFLRFPTLSPLQAHPFTIVTLPFPDATRESVMTVLARARGGMTRALYDTAMGAPSSDAPGSGGAEKERYSIEKDGNGDVPDLSTQTIRLPASIDGPYGTDASIASFDSALLIAGGVGGTFVLPILTDLATRTDPSAACTRDVALIWSVRTPALLTWLAPQLEVVQCLLEEHGITLRIQIHITRSDSEELGVSLRSILPSSVPADDIRTGRADMALAVDDAVERAGAARSTSLAVVVCGPPGMSRSVSQRAAQLQGRILRRQAGSLKELYLLNESFSW